MNTKQLLAATVALVSASRVFAGTITFEGAPQGQDLGSYYQGVTFGADAQATGQTIIAGDPAHSFPAHSGTMLLTDNNLFNPVLSFTFDTPQSSLSFWFNSLDALTLNVTDTGGGTLATSPLSATAGVNHQVVISSGIANIKTITITDNTGLGTFFTIDDLTSPGVSGLPAPDATSTLALLGVAGAGLLAFRRKLATR